MGSSEAETGEVSVVGLAAAWAEGLDPVLAAETVGGTPAEAAAWPEPASQAAEMALVAAGSEAEAG